VDRSTRTDRSDREHINKRTDRKRKRDKKPHGDVSGVPLLVVNRKELKSSKEKTKFLKSFYAPERMSKDQRMRMKRSCLICGKFLCRATDHHRREHSLSSKLSVEMCDLEQLHQKHTKTMLLRSEILSNMERKHKNPEFLKAFENLLISLGIYIFLDVPMITSCKKSSKTASFSSKVTSTPALSKTLPGFNASASIVNASQTLSSSHPSIELGTVTELDESIQPQVVLHRIAQTPSHEHVKETTPVVEEPRSTCNIISDSTSSDPAVVSRDQVKRFFNAVENSEKEPPNWTWTDLSTDDESDEDPLSSDSSDEESETRQRHSSTLCKLRRKAIGLDKGIPWQDEDTEDNVIADFARSLKALETSDFKNDTNKVANIMYYLQNQFHYCTQKPDIKVFGEKGVYSEIEKYFTRLKTECSMLPSSLKNEYTALSKFFKHLSGMDLCSKNCELWQRIQDLLGKLNLAKKANYRKISLHMNKLSLEKRNKRNTGAIDLHAGMEFRKCKKLQEEIKSIYVFYKDSKNADHKNEDRGRHILFTRYLMSQMAYSCAQRAGVPASLTMEEFLSAYLEDFGFIGIDIANHKTAASKPAHLSITPLEKELCDIYAKHFRMPGVAVDGNNCFFRLFNTQKRIRNSSAQFTALQKMYDLSHCTTGSHRGSMATLCYVAYSANQHLHKSMANAMRHSISTTDKYYLDGVESYIGPNKTCNGECNWLRDQPPRKREAL
jgi:hypothetical protein